MGRRRQQSGETTPVDEMEVDQFSPLNAETPDLAPPEVSDEQLPDYGECVTCWQIFNLIVLFVCSLVDLDYHVCWVVDWITFNPFLQLNLAQLISFSVSHQVLRKR